MSDFETTFLVKAQTYEDYQLLFPLWNEVTEYSIDMDDEANFCFGGFQNFAEDLMKNVIKVGQHLTSENIDMTYNIIGKSVGDDGEIIILEILANLFESSVKALYASEDDEDGKYYEYESLHMEEISKKLKRCKFRPFKTVIDKKALDFLTVYQNNGYDSWITNCLND